MTSDQLIRHHGIECYRAVAEEAADATIRYREWFLSHEGRAHSYDGVTAEDLVDDVMGGESWITKAKVLTVACAMAKERGLALTSLQRQEIRRRRVA